MVKSVIVIRCAEIKTGREQKHSPKVWQLEERLSAQLFQTEMFLPWPKIIYKYTWVAGNITASLYLLNLPESFLKKK